MSHSLTRRRFMGQGAALAATVAAGCTAAREETPSQPPNIVFVMLDDLGYADFGCYGGTMIQTPNVDQLAAESLRFTDCYAGGAVCAPSRSVLMTGRHTGHTSIRANAGTAPILPEDVTVGEVLKDAGYATGVFGKWGLGDAHTTGEPRLQGFDESFGYLHQIHAHSYYPDFLWRNGEKVPLPGNAGDGQDTYTANLIFDESVEFVRRHRDKPFFLYGAYTLPHGRYQIPDQGPYADKDWPEEEKNYAAMVTLADDHIGRLVATIREMGLEENTIIFVTSDNGGTESRDEFFNSNGPLRGHKGNLYEGGIRVPMIVRWAGKTDPGRVSSVPWAFYDFLPTAAELAGASAPDDIDGASVLPTIIGSSQPVHERLYWEHHRFARQQSALDPSSMQQAARQGDWKAVIPSPDSPLELYNLAEDIGETNDQAADQPEIAAELKEYMASEHSEPRPQVGGTFEFATD